MKKSEARKLIEDFAKYVNSDGCTVITKGQAERYISLLDEPVDLRRPRSYSKKYKESFA